MQAGQKRFPAKGRHSPFDPNGNAPEWEPPAGRFSQIWSPIPIGFGLEFPVSTYGTSFAYGYAW